MTQSIFGQISGNLNNGGKFYTPVAMGILELEAPGGDLGVTEQALRACQVAYTSSAGSYTNAAAAYTASAVAYTASAAAYSGTAVAYTASAVAYSGTAVLFSASQVNLTAALADAAVWHGRYDTKVIELGEAQVAYSASAVAYTASNDAYVLAAAAFSASDSAYILAAAAATASAGEAAGYYVGLTQADGLFNRAEADASWAAMAASVIADVNTWQTSYPTP